MKPKLLIFDLSKYFRSVLGGGDIEKLKPDPEGIKTQIVEAGAPASVKTVARH